jgi:hypothetical protein
MEEEALECAIKLLKCTGSKINNDLAALNASERQSVQVACL